MLWVSSGQQSLWRHSFVPQNIVCNRIWYFCRWKLEHENVVKLSDDCCLICVVCFDDTNCLDYSNCSHRRVAKEDPSMTIVVDLCDHQNPHEVAAIGLKVLCEAVVEDATMNDAKHLFEEICRKSLQNKICHLIKNYFFD